MPGRLRLPRPGGGYAAARLRGGAVRAGCAECCEQAPEGGCCLSGGACSVLTPAACATAGGTYQGDGTGCSPNPCQQFGACCFASGQCISETAANCFAYNGLYQGNGTVCVPNPCPVRSCCNNDPTGAKCWMRSGLTPTLVVSASASFTGSICARPQSNPTGPTQEFPVPGATITTASNPDQFAILNNVRCKFEAEAERTQNSPTSIIASAGDPVFVPGGCPHSFQLWIGAQVVQNDSFPAGIVEYFIFGSSGSSGVGSCSTGPGGSNYFNTVPLPGCIGTFDLPHPGTLSASSGCQSGSANFTATISYLRITISNGFQACRLPSGFRAANKSGLLVPRGRRVRAATAGEALGLQGDGLGEDGGSGGSGGCGGCGQGEGRRGVRLT